MQDRFQIVLESDEIEEIGARRRSYDEAEWWLTGRIYD